MTVRNDAVKEITLKTCVYLPQLDFCSIFVIFFTWNKSVIANAHVCLYIRMYMSVY